MPKTLIALFVLFGLAGPVMAQSNLPTASAIRAHEKSQAGDWYLIDIRTRGEWKQGVAEGAALISMHEPGFLQKLDLLTGGDKQAKLALICATGGRTGQIQYPLMIRGWPNVYNVAEGMHGSRSGPGWIARDLPVVKPDL